MSDTDQTDDGDGRKPLTLKPRQGAGTVRQSFPHGRSKAVVVEKKRRRVVTPKDKAAAAAAAKAELTPEQKAARALGLSEEEVRRRQAAINAARDQAAERDQRRRAEDGAREAREEADRRRVDEERERAAASEARRKAEEEEIARQAAEEEARRAEANRPSRSEPAARADSRGDARSDSRGDAGGSSRRDAMPTPLPPGEDTLEGLGGRVKRARTSPQPTNAKPTPRTRNDGGDRRRQKLTINAALDEDGGERQRSLAAMRRAREKERQRRMDSGGEREKVRREVIIPEVITIGELANRMAERSADVIRFLVDQGQWVRANDVIDPDTAELIVGEFGHTVKRVSESDVEQGFLTDDDADEDKQPRPPVVAVMGHVDHGKTSLLDALRATDVASGEAGGITQHIGAYQVKTKAGDRVTFLDTPGHAAFSAMRARGANVTDIVILVVAADDGVMPQTIEAINHAKASGAPMIVAVNKCDKHEANPDKVLQDLLQYEVFVESLGGDVQAVQVSALKKTGLDELLEAINLQAELLELKANPDRSAEGIVIESQLDRGRGPVATVLVGRGALRRGDLVVAGSAWGRVRALTNERGQQVKEALPSTPVEVLGLDAPPDPGEPFAVVENEARARELTDYRDRVRREKTGASGGMASLEQMMAKLKDKTASELAVLVKADVQGSAEAITQALDALGNDEVKARVIHQAVGGVNESDVSLAKASAAPIIAFNVRANKQARDLAEREGVEIRYYSIIYNLLDDIRGSLQGMLAPEKREDFIGYAEILEVFNISKVGKVAGCRITEGVVRRGCGVRLLRDDVVIHEGELSTLKRFKDEVPEVKSGMECGMGFMNYHDLQVGDRIECFTVTEVERTL